MICTNIQRMQSPVASLTRVANCLLDGKPLIRTQNYRIPLRRRCVASWARVTPDTHLLIWEDDNPATRTQGLREESAV